MSERVSITDFIDMVKKDIIDSPMGHKWVTDEDGEVDFSAHSIGFHNGPVCAKCGYSFCMFCTSVILECGS